MTSLLELREKVKQFYYKYEMYITPVLTFVLALVTFVSINSNIGYMSLLNNFLVVLILSLGCAFLPMGVLVLVTAFVSLAHMYSISMEIALVGFCVYFVMYLLYFRLGRKDTHWVLLTMVMFFLNVPYVAPVAVGLLCAPSSIVPMVFGIISCYLIQTIGASAEAASAASGESVDVLQLTMDSLLSNRAMVLVVVVFAISAGIVYVIRRLAIEHAWKTAVVVGAAFQMIVVLIGSLIMKVDISILGLLFGTVLAVAGGLTIEFFRLLLDYRRTEKVQYEDDEYYYYVTAVPKVTVEVLSQPGRRTKTAGAGRRPGTAGTGRPVSRGGAVRQPRPTTQRRPVDTVRPAGTARVTTQTGAVRYPNSREEHTKRVVVRSYDRPETTAEEYTE